MNELKSALKENTTSLASVTDINQRTKTFASNWENALITGLLDSALIGLRGKEKKKKKGHFVRD